MNYKNLSLSGLVAAPLLLPNADISAAEPPKPNIVFILADDLGWSDVGYNGAKFYETPNIDSMCKTGMKFNRAYSAGPNCLPTRACLLSGMYTPRTQIWTPGGKSKGKKENMKLLTPTLSSSTLPSKLELKSSVISIAEVLKTAGYKTGRFGKWHVGRDTQGFDVSESDGKGGDLKKNHYGSPDVHEWLTDASCKFIEDNKNKPFFLYLTHWDVHLPLKVRSEYLKPFEKKLKESTWNYKWNPKYAGMIKAVDISVGRVRDKLKELGLDKNTLFIFSSDNGGHASVTTNAPLLAGKGAFFEGGVRVPTYMVWPGVIKPGTECNTPITSVDFMPTFAEVAGAELPKDQPVDGISILPLLKGEKLKKRAIFWHYPMYLSGHKLSKVLPVHGTENMYWRAVPSSMIMKGDWKLMHLFEDNSIRLYNVADDISEAKDLSKEQPKIAQRLFEELKAWQKETMALIPTEENPEFSGKKNKEK